MIINPGAAIWNKNTTTASFNRDQFLKSLAKLLICRLEEKVLKRCSTAFTIAHVVTVQNSVQFYCPWCWNTSVLFILNLENSTLNVQGNLRGQCLLLCFKCIPLFLFFYILIFLFTRDLGKQIVYIFDQHKKTFLRQLDLSLYFIPYAFFYNLISAYNFRRL